MREVPIYFIAGFLEAGKTRFINEMLADEQFSNGEKTVIICCEEGFDEYNEKLLRSTATIVEYCESPKDFTTQFLKNIDARYKPERIFIEYNGTWLLSDLAGLKLPRGWVMVECVTLINFETFKNYLNNMRQMVSDAVMKSYLIIFNRADATKVEEKRSFRKAVRALNPNAEILFDNTDGTMDDGRTEDDLPYDMTADVIDISNDDFGAWYIDAMDNPQRYEGRTLKLRGMALYTDNKGGFAFGRRAMTCCADDIRAIGFACEKTADKPAENAWIEATVEAKQGYSELHGRDALILEIKKFKSASKPKDDLVYFN